MYEIVVERAAERDLRRLSPDVFRRVIAAVQQLAEEPRPSGVRKIVGSDADWRIRIGVMRVVYEIDDDAQVVRVMRVRHRRDAYR